MTTREKAVSLLEYWWFIFNDPISIYTGLRGEFTRKAALRDANKALNEAFSIKGYIYWKEVIIILENC